MASARVVLFNDDITTMEFVVQILEQIFGKTRDEALRLVLYINREGHGVCGVTRLSRPRTWRRK